MYQLGLGWALLRLVLKGGEALTQQPLVAAIVMTAVAIVSSIREMPCSLDCATLEARYVEAAANGAIPG